MEWAITLDPLASRWDSRNLTHSGIALGATKNTITLDPPSSNNNASYVGRTVTLTSGNGAGQSATITAYNPITKVATISPAWRQNAVGSSENLFDTSVWNDLSDGANPILQSSPPDITAPDGTYTAWKWGINDISFNRSFSGNAVDSVIGRRDRFSFYVYIPSFNAGSHLRGYMFSGGDIPPAPLNLNDVQFVRRNTWTRVSFSWTWAAGAIGPIAVQPHGNFPDTVGDLMYLWHPQLELDTTIQGEYITTPTNAPIFLPTTGTGYTLT